MRVLLPVILLQLVKLCVIAFAFTVLGSAGHNIQPSPAKFSVISPVEGTPGPIHHRKLSRSLAPSSASDPNGSNLHPAHAIPPIPSTPMPRIFEGLAPSLSPNTPIEVPPYNTAPPPLVLHDHVPSLPPIPPLSSPPPSLAPLPSSSPRAPVNFLPPSSLPVLSPPPNTTPPPSSSPRTLVIPNTTPPSLSRRTPVLSPPPTTTPPPSSSPRTLVIISPPPDTAPPSSSPRTPVLSPPPTTTPPPSSSPRTLVISPPPTTTHPPSLSPRTPVISPPPTTTPPLSLSPRTPVISPPPTPTPPPSSSPRTLVISPPTNTTPPPSSSPRTVVIISPPPNTTPPSLSRRTPVLSPPPITTPPPSSSPRTLVIISPPPDTTPPSSSPRTPVLSPPPTTTPPPSSSPRTPVISPPPTTTHSPSLSPRTPVISPPPTTTPSPLSSPRTPVISPPPSTTPPPSSSPRTLVIISPPPITTPPSWSRRTPVLSPPPITTPPPSSSPRTLVMISPPPNTTPPSLSPRAPVLSPPPTTTPPPSSSPRTLVISPPPTTTHPPSLSPRTLVISPPPTTTPPPSLSPRTSVISPPPNTTPPPSSSPRTPVISPASDTTPLPSLTPKLPVVSPPPSTVPTTPVVLPPSYLVPPPSSMPKIPISSPPSSTPTNPIVSPPANLAPPPSLTLTTPVISSPSNSAPPPFTIEGLVPSTVPSAPPRKSTVSVPGAPVATPLRNSPQNSPSSYPSIPGALPPIFDGRNASNNMAPIIEPVAPVPVSSSTSKFKPGEPPSVLPDLDIPPASSPTTSFDRNKDGIPVSEPPHEMPKPLSPVSHSPTKGPSAQQSMGHPDARIPPLSSPRSPPNKGHHSQASSPSTSFPKQHHASNRVAAPASLYFISPTASTQPGPVIQPGRGDSVPPPLYPVNHVSPAPSPAPLAAASQTEKSPKMPVLPPILALPPPPPNGDCSTTVCTEPYANTPPGVPCGCVLPIKVGLRLSVALYTFFPLVSELASEIAAGVFMKQSQVRIMGADAASQQPEKTVVLVDLVPLGEKINKTTAFLTYQRFWHKQVVIQSSFFGDYEVLYVLYPGLPPSPPSASSGIGKIDNGPYSSNGNNAPMKPEGVDVPNRRQSYGVNRSIVIIVLSAFVAVVVSSAIAWVLLFKYRGCVSQSAPVLGHFQQSHAKPLGAAGSMTGSGLESAPLSFGSSIATYTGSAKTFSASDIERATGNFDASRILGEGGFGLVYSGVLEDGTKVAVKVLKRGDRQGGREFLAEVEMLSRLHHRNLVKLIGICIEEHARCLVYELIPNGSVESHLHGVDKESAPLGWDARLKIALGAARGLAYLHEDSSPRVIHRDFKSSNILLEHDFTPKVSDFGLARTAMDEANTHISTRVMGTFGYVAPEYAMTGHLLVKSDVYSYGVVLLELLTGRKPVEMTQLPGQENLVAWARPFLTSREGLEMIIDKSLGDDVQFDCVAKVAAIASMCVQPEVTHRPFMGEVVQALKLVCNEFDEAKEQELGSRSSSRDDLFIDFDPRVTTSSGQLLEPLQSQHSVPNYDLGIDTEKGGLPVSELFSSSARYGGKDESGSVTRYSSSGPLRTGNGRQFWQTIRRLSTGTVSEEHSHALRLRPGSH